MLTVIAVRDPLLRDALVSHISGMKQKSDNPDIVYYQKNASIIAFSDTLSWTEMTAHATAEYAPSAIYIAVLGWSVDMEHEIGDIVLPHTFLSYNPAISDISITPENRDTLMGKAEFLDTFIDARDYYVETFGLSVGGIIVDSVPKNTDPETLMSVYAADIYTDISVREIRECITTNEAPTLCIAGIIEGKKSTHAGENAMAFVAENILTAARLLTEDIE